MEKENWFTIDNIDDFDTPALIVYPDRALNNIRLLKSMVRDISNLRPHVKTHKMVEVTQMLIREGISQFKCATIAEAEMLALAGAKDVLLAYQPVGPKIKRLLSLIKKFPLTTYSCLVDNMDHASVVASTFDQEGLNIPVYIDLNVGMNRTGVPIAGCLDLYFHCQTLKGVHPMGLHVYDGHLRDPDINKRKEMCDKCFEDVSALADAIEAKTGSYPIIIAGGSPSFPIHAQRDRVVCSPGTFIFWDSGYYTTLPEQKFEFAALVASRVISILDKNLMTLDLGHKAVAADPALPRVQFLNLPDAVQISQSEEHLVVKVPDTSLYRIGDVFYAVPIHICPTCALHEKALVVRDGKIHDKWNVVARRRALSV